MREALIASCWKRVTISTFVGVLGAQHLERDALFDGGVLGQVHLAHAAFPEQLDDLVASRHGRAEQRVSGRLGGGGRPMVQTTVPPDAADGLRTGKITRSPPSEAAI